MKTAAATLAALLATATGALALSDAAIPTKVPTSWGQSAPPGNITCPIPIPSQIAISSGRASWTDGFPPLTFLPLAGGGVPPFGQDMNGVFCQISQWTRWYNAGAPISYDATFQSAVGGYPNGAMIQSVTNSGHFWLSTVDNNVSNPDAGGANWQDLYLAALKSTYVATAGGTANALTLSVVGWTTNAAGVGVPLQFGVSTANTNTTTLIVNGVGSPVLMQKKTASGLANMVAGDLQPGLIYVATFDGTVFEVTTVSKTGVNLVVISASGTYTPSVGIVSADVACVGGGAAGGGAVTTTGTQYSAGSGGGSGGITEKTYLASDLLPNVSVTVGAGGTGVPGGNGNPGANTTFLGMTAGGGAGGFSFAAVTQPSLTSQPGGAGGTATGGALNTPGSYGGTAFVFVLAAAPQTQATSGSGANGYNGGGGGVPVAFGNTTAGSNGAAGAGFGSGGSGAANGNSNSNHSGGNGAGGGCFVKEYISQ